MRRLSTQLQDDVFRSRVGEQGNARLTCLLQGAHHIIQLEGEFPPTIQAVGDGQGVEAGGQVGEGQGALAVGPQIDIGRNAAGDAAAGDGAVGLPRAGGGSDDRVGQLDGGVLGYADQGLLRTAVGIGEGELVRTGIQAGGHRVGLPIRPEVAVGGRITQKALHFIRNSVFSFFITVITLTHDT